MTRHGWLVGLACVAGCWSEDDGFDGFTADQWTALQKQLAPVPLSLCSSGDFCAAAKALAGELFFDTRMSGNNMVSCASCHDPKHALIDSRTPNATSMGVNGLSKRNSISLLDDGEKRALANGRDVFTWIGSFKQPGDLQAPGDVLELAIQKPLASSDMKVAGLIRNDGNYWMQYQTMGGLPTDNDAAIVRNLELAFTAYISELLTEPTPFDSYLAGHVDAMTPAARRGFKIFVGKGTCIECHNTYLLSDLDPHNTGVQQTLDDLGRAQITGLDADTGKFVTPSLREVAATGPYMHNGSFPRLADVIAFYRRGGDAGIGTRDPRIAPLDLTDDDALDLEAFLLALSDHDCDDAGSACGSGSGMPLRDSGPAPTPDATVPDSRVPDASSPCPMPMTLCGAMCVDLTTDPMNCSACGSACTSPKPNCVGGTCVR